MILRIFGHDFHYECENLCRVYFPNEKINIVYGDDGEDSKTVVTRCSPISGGNLIEVEAGIDGKSRSFKARVLAPEEELRDKSELKTAQLIYAALSELTGYTPPWGVLTGVRPSKLMIRLTESMGEQAAYDYFTKDLLVSGEKARLAQTVAAAEKEIISLSRSNSFSLYVSIPFCPTRCSYCSFVSHSITNSNAKKLLPEYLKKLAEEIEITGNIASQLGLRLESIYFGGGTPGVLNAEQLDSLLCAVDKSFDLSQAREYTVEIGRPDTVTPEKLSALRLHGVGRISINPQTFNRKTLEAIGRNHSVEQAVEAYRLAETYGFDSINTDLIAGLPGETVEDFCKSIDAALELSPENITVHTLALKRSSELNASGAGVSGGKAAAEMLEYASSALTGGGYSPYYMYRQSKCVGNLENVGWCKSGKECLYNVFMMEECHTVLAVGAGAVTKLCEPGTTNVERIFNYKYPYEYISGFDKITERKNGIKRFYLS
ncbi:MAG: coproporphyrinogen dehydrogenase HemZ [Oscillospiraceae bacterium]|nr:coproporphyrinogen dehydrogenase HemZ [Clostridiaceae bacterium]MDY5949328.1 coproporphyrinogen dehydrogenase HemZ [Oscillospiraceae bacterium]